MTGSIFPEDKIRPIIMNKNMRKFVIDYYKSIDPEYVNKSDDEIIEYAIKLISSVTYEDLEKDI